MERINEFLSTNKLALVLSFIGLVLIAGGVFSSGIAKSTSSKTNYPKESLVKTSDLSQFKVDISGAVIEPGVYSLGSGSRVEDAIKLAGGFSAKVNQEYISKTLNLSQKVSDGQKIYVPFEGEQGVVLAAQTSNGVSSGVIVGINSGSLNDLDKLPGIGPVTAQKIVDGRPFNTVSDLLSKKIISKSVFEKIKDLVDIN